MKFHSEIPYSRELHVKTIFRIYQGQITHGLEQSGSLSQYVIFDEEHICKVPSRYTTKDRNYMSKTIFSDI